MSQKIPRKFFKNILLYQRRVRQQNAGKKERKKKSQTTGSGLDNVKYKAACVFFG